MNMRFFLLLVLAIGSVSIAGCGGCSSVADSRAAVLRGRAGDFGDDEEGAPPTPTPVADDESPAPPAASPAPAPSPTPTAESPKPTPAPATGVASAPPAVQPTAPAVVAPPEIYPSDLVPKAPSEPLAETSPVKQVVPAIQSGEQLSPLDRRARTIDNLKRIGTALNAYVAQNGTLPPRAIRNDKGEATLSWRVAILPHLGYDELLKQFRLFEPWDSPHNRQLLAQIPPEFASPERRDTNTNYLAVLAPDSAFQGARGANPARFEDGAENTLIVVEADDPQAAPWTKPSDLAMAAAAPRSGLGAQRGDGFLGLLADGRVKRIPPELPDLVVRALCTTDGAEPLTAAEWLKEPTLEPAAVAAAPADVLAELLAGVPKPTAPTPSSALGKPAPTDAALGRLPIPDEDSLLKSRALLRELYGKEVQAARTPEERARLATRLLAEATKVEANAADYHELVRIARDMAAAVGDANTALKADDLLVKKFQIDPIAAQLKVLRDLSGPVRAPQAAATLAQKSKELLLGAYEQDDFETVFQAHNLLVDYTKLKGDRTEVLRVQALKPGLEAARQAYAAIPAQLKTLEADPNDADANESVGKYLCLIKNRWEAGLPLLVRCGDVRLRIVATIDLEPIRSPQDTLKLADQYWDMAADYKQPFARGLHLRSVHCYQQAVAQLGGSFDKLRAQKRLDEVIGFYGKEEVQRALGQTVVGGSGFTPTPGTAVGVPVPGSAPRGVPVPGTSGG